MQTHGWDVRSEASEGAAAAADGLTDVRRRATDGGAGSGRGECMRHMGREYVVCDNVRHVFLSHFLLVIYDSESDSAS